MIESIVEGGETLSLRLGIIDSFDDYWDSIEAGIGLMPQAYLALPEPSRRAVREEVQARAWCRPWSHHILLSRRTR